MIFTKNRLVNPFLLICSKNFKLYTVNDDLDMNINNAQDDRDQMEFEAYNSAVEDFIKEGNEDFYTDFFENDLTTINSEVLDNPENRDNNKLICSLNDNNLNLFTNTFDETFNQGIDENILIDEKITLLENQPKSFLDSYGTNLTTLAQKGQLEECFGREEELLEVMEILARRQKNNPVLIGEAGVGKTAVVELFATKIVKNLVPFVLEGRSIISLDISSIMAGAKFRGEFEERFQGLLNEILSTPNIIIFIDEIHTIVGAGSAEGSADVANLLKPVLSRSGFQCIGATTIKEYKILEKDPALKRRFQPVFVNEPSVKDTINILYSIRPSLEVFHNVEIQPIAIKLAAELSARYIYDRFLPDKAIDLLDRAAAKEVIKNTQILSGSLIVSIINGGLKNIGILKLEAFRRGDIASEYIFQEIENAYNKFLLQWMESPLSITKTCENFSSAISQELYTKMRLSVLKRIDELLVSSTQCRSIKQNFSKTKNLSKEKNNLIYQSLRHNSKINLYRLSLVCFIEWITQSSNTKLTKNFNINSFILKTKYLNKLGTNTSTLKFYNEDLEKFVQNTLIFSELEEKRFEIFQDYIKNLKPLLRKGLVESLKYSSQLSLSKTELSLIYNLLGFYSADLEQTFLTSLNEPKLMLQARNLHNFSALKNQITEKKICSLLTILTGIPVDNLTVGESQKLLNLETILHQSVIGQEEAISAIAKAIRRARIGIQKLNRPLASFLFCGPTGVGKTEVTKALAKTMFGSVSDMIRLDMSEFMEKFTISRLIGSPPGYVGYEDGGQLTNAVRSKPYSVVLFDELEKAHPDILNILLQILEDGRLTDAQKNLVRFDNTVIILTSNAAANEIQHILKKDPKVSASKSNILNRSNPAEHNLFKSNTYINTIKFLNSPITQNFLVDIKTKLKTELKKSQSSLAKSILDDKKQKDFSYVTDKQLKLNKLLKQTVLERLNTLFLPEFLNRLDDIIIFKPLKPEELRTICDIMIQELSDRLQAKQIRLIVDENVKAKLSREGYNPAFGARPLRRLITKYIEDLISENMLKYMVVKVERTIQIILNTKNQIVIKN
jgi:ATP-dependent Clp protease ATP-binding subunit ClpA